SAKSLLLDIEQNIKTQENALSLLLNRFPEKIERSSFANQDVVFNGQDGVSIHILNNRPDVIAAEMRFKNAFELTNVAKASFYPTLRLTASGGLQSVDLINCLILLRFLQV